MGQANLVNSSVKETVNEDTNQPKVAKTRTFTLNCSASSDGNIGTPSDEPIKPEIFSDFKPPSNVADFAVGSRTFNDVSPMSISVLALPFNDTYDFGHATVTFDRHAFDNTIRSVEQGDHYFYLAAGEHKLDAPNLLGRSDVAGGPGSVTAFIDDKGLWLMAELPRTQMGYDTYELVRTKVLTKASVGIEIEEQYDQNGDPINYSVSRENGQTHYTYQDVRLIETSLVARPAFEGTNVQSLDMSEEQGEQDEPVELDDSSLTNSIFSEFMKLMDRHSELMVEYHTLRSQTEGAITETEQASEVPEDVSSVELAKEEVTSSTDPLWRLLTTKGE